MSGIYIKGIEMPKSCYDCPCNKDDGFGFFTCGVTKSECDFIRLPPDCPLFPVPEHGRLIDADKMRESIRRQTGLLKLMGGELSDLAETIEKGFLQEIANAPTIIPADKEGEG